MMHKKKAYILVSKTKVLKHMRLSAYSCQDLEECMCHKQLLIHNGFTREVKKKLFLFSKKWESFCLHTSHRMPMLRYCRCQREDTIAPLLVFNWVMRIIKVSTFLTATHFCWQNHICHNTIMKLVTPWPQVNFWHDNCRWTNLVITYKYIYGKLYCCRLHYNVISLFS